MEFYRDFFALMVVRGCTIFFLCLSVYLMMHSHSTSKQKHRTAISFMMCCLRLISVDVRTHVYPHFIVHLRYQIVTISKDSPKDCKNIIKTFPHLIAKKTLCVVYTEAHSTLLCMALKLTRWNWIVSQYFLLSHIRSLSVWLKKDFWVWHNSSKWKHMRIWCD